MQRSMLAAIVFCLVCLPAFSQDQPAIDWPTFQGNNARTGVSDYPPIKNPTIAWSKQLGIMGYLNNPVIDGDFIFVGSSGDKHNKSDDRDGVYCLSLKTGEILWHHQTQTDACGVAIDRDRVFVGDDGGRFRALDRKTGEVAWAIDLEGSVFAQPIIVGELVIVGNADHDSGKGTVFAIDIPTGKIQWMVDGDGRIRGGVSSDGESIYATFLHGEIVCMDLKGKELWKKKPRENGGHTEMYPAPTIADGELYFGFARGTYYDVPALGCYSTLGEKRWVNKETDFNGPDGRSFGNIRSSAAIDGQSLVYAEPYGNQLVWVSRKTGRFEESIALGAPMFPHWPSPVIAKRQLYIARHDGGLYAVDLDERRMQWMLYLGDHKQAGQEFLPKNIVPADWPDGAWEPNVGKPIYATPAIARDGTLVIGTGEGWLYCIREASK